MKILCVIDSLGSGGAQRQMANLVCGLKSKGHAVELLLFFPELDFFRTEIEHAGILIHEVSKSKGFSWNVVWNLVNLYRIGRYDGVISFLDTPNFFAEIAQIFALYKANLIVSERRSYEMEGFSLRLKFLRLCHLLATRVAANSYSHAKWLRKRFLLNQKISTIYNGYCLNVDSSITVLHQTPSKLHLFVFSRIDVGKNGLRLLKGLIRFYEKHGNCPKISWAGRQELDRTSLRERQEMEEFLVRYPEINRNWQFLGERKDVSALMKKADAVIHVSLYEGLPNAICEAFIASRPVIASNVCDHPLLVEDGVRGFLCDPLSPESISNAIYRFSLLTREERHQMCRNARSYAEKHLSLDRMISDYEALLLLGR